ncbi:thiamine transporter [Bacillus cytotoxicus]|uniref:Thiamine transporter n=2 Tax=Bacillus cytotoxicus TaxID=580165 RepID=A0AAX2CLJ2_9BACI|nr:MULTISPECIES: hypothetical protein [Bacillus cereus group]ABS23567.1 conserved hypothetical protein [Bacillus cytotoxicus NVH 391-98]AWC30164.1 thiamine transporter [Bacillus cytotoxicus]AWC34210.1 thiamine transporter [Bacillus cytotoxicus]AWC38210.1 thiamine transporter [Bacillus cytotoxicus]AWC42301.1 thiamine transporter [Bacillus cytotoxicus]
MMQQQKIKELLERIEVTKKHDVEIDSYEIYLFHKDEIEKGQIGYRYDKNNHSLIGENEGEWKESWIVIGYETDMGDPIFVDTDNALYPIYTANKGREIWEPVCIADSINEIINQLQDK